MRTFATAEQIEQNRKELNEGHLQIAIEGLRLLMDSRRKAVEAEFKIERKLRTTTLD